MDPAHYEKLKKLYAIYGNNKFLLNIFPNMNFYQKILEINL